MKSIPDAVAHILLRPAPVVCLDTCSLIDLFRRDATRGVAAEELQAATDLLEAAVSQPAAVHVVVPELVPGEFTDNAAKVTTAAARWFDSYDDNAEWLSRVAKQFGVAWAVPPRSTTLGVTAACHKLATDLLASATVLARDQACLDRAIQRVVGKQRPSQTNQVKDSMNLEQCLELSRQLRHAGFASGRVFVSSNTNDFAENAQSKTLHPDLAAEFAAAGLDYFTSLRPVVNHYRKIGVI